MPSPLHTCFTIFFGFVDITVLYRLYIYKLGYRFSKKSHPISYLATSLLYFLVLYSSNIFPDIPIKMVFFFMLSACIYVITKGTPFKKIFWIITGFFITIIAEVITLPIVMLFTKQTDMAIVINTPATHITVLFASRLLIVVVIELLLRSTKRLYSGLIKDFFLIVLVDVIYALLVTSLFYIESKFITAESAIILSLFAVMLISALSLLLLRKIAKKSDEIIVTNLKLQQMEMEHKQNQDMTHIVESLRSLRHDMNNHMSVLHGLLSMGEIADAQSYLESISKDLEVANTFFFTENKILSVLLNNKISKANALGIHLEIELLTNTTPFADDELCAVLGNILENAIEANTEHENPHIFFSMKKSDRKLLIQCDNTYTKAPIFENGQLITSKTDKSYHGIGTQNIRSIVDRHHGTILFSTDELFHVDIAIPL